MLFIIIIITVAAVLFFSLHNFNKSVQDAVILEQTRTQEKIVIDDLQTDEETAYITAIRVNNVGSVAIRIRSLYIDNTLIFDPYTSINPKEYALIQLPPETPYVSTYTISVASERGMKSSVKEGDFVEIYQQPLKTNFYFRSPTIGFRQILLHKIQP